MADAPWDAIGVALAEAAAKRGAVRFWLRDDDAVEPTPALDRLGELCGCAGLPILLAVIPAGVTGPLAGWLVDHPLVTPCQHGYAHANHAEPGARACELGGARPDAAVLAELEAGRRHLGERLGVGLSDILVPPWNRIRPSLVPHLSGCGFGALSTFAGGKPAEPTAPAALPRIDCDLDIIDWRNGRRGRSLDDLAARLQPLIARAGETGQPIGLLTHHLAHDAAAWRFLDEFLRATCDGPHVAFTSAATELRRML